MTGIHGLEDRATGLGLPGERVDGTDVLAVREAVLRGADRARSGLGPSLLVADCYRSAGHFSGDALKYRDPTEAASWRQREPIPKFQAQLLQAGIMGDSEIKALADKAEAEVAAALVFAKASPLPDSRQAWEDLYAPG